MAMPEVMLKDWELLNEQNQRQTLAFMRFLLSQQEEDRADPPRRLGALAHRFKGIADDFDAPLPEFKEYM